MLTPLVHPLSYRQRRVLVLHAAGLTFAQIGTVFGIGARTVHSHATVIRNRLGTRTLDAAVERALLLGEITAEQIARARVVGTGKG